MTLSITPFGNTGPYRDFVAEDITIANAGGWANLCPRTHTDPSLPPLKVFGNQAAMMAGIAGATAALATFRDARRSGVGDYIDLSAQAYIASGLEGAIPGYTYQGVVRRRYELNPWGTFEAQDGPILMLCMEESQWERIVEFMGHPEWTELEMFANQRTRHQNYDAIIHFYQEFISGWNAFELFHAGQARRICLAPVMNFEQVASDRHLRARDGFVTVDHPETGPVEYLAPAVLTTSGRAEIRRPAPRLGEHNAEVLAEVSAVTEGASATPVNETDLPQRNDDDSVSEERKRELLAHLKHANDGSPDARRRITLWRTPRSMLRSRARPHLTWLQLFGLSGAPPAGGGSGRRPVLGLGGAVRRDASRAPRRGGHTLRVFHAPGSLPPGRDLEPAGRHGTVVESRRHVQPVEPGQEERGGRSQRSAGNRDRQRVRRRIGRGAAELRHRRDGPPRTGLRGTQAHQPAHHPREHQRLRSGRALPRVPGVRSGTGAAHRVWLR